MQAALPRLRPMRLSDILDTIFRLYRSNFVTFFGIAALIQIPVIVFQLSTELVFGQRYMLSFVQLAEELPFFDPQRDSFSDLPIGDIIPYLVISLLISLLQVVVVQQLVSGALANAISRRYMDQPISMLGAYHIGARRIIALIVVGILLGLIGSVIFAVLMGVYLGGIVAIISATAQAGSGAVSLILAFFCLILFLLLLIASFALIAVRFLFITQAIVIEGYGPMRSLGRSWRLVSGSFWRVLGIAFVLFLLVQVVAYLPTIIVSFILGATMGSLVDPLQNYTLRQSLLILVNYVAQILVLPLQLGAYTLLYYDLRIRKEGFDIQLLAEEYTASPGA